MKPPQGSPQTLCRKLLPACPCTQSKDRQTPPPPCTSESDFEPARLEAESCSSPRASIASRRSSSHAGLGLPSSNSCRGSEQVCVGGAHMQAQPAQAHGRRGGQAWGLHSVPSLGHHDYELHWTLRPAWYGKPLEARSASAAAASLSSSDSGGGNALPSTFGIAAATASAGVAYQPE